MSEDWYERPTLKSCRSIGSAYFHLESWQRDQIEIEEIYLSPARKLLKSECIPTDCHHSGGVEELDLWAALAQGVPAVKQRACLHPCFYQSSRISH